MENSASATLNTHLSYESLIPAEKGLDPSWVDSLFLRGSQEVISGEHLKYIGMPIGGLCAGQVYLGGDGVLWLWDIFNQHYEGVCGNGREGENYVVPLVQNSPFQHGFSIRVTKGNEVQERSLDKAGFSQIDFRGEYPVGYVDYREPLCPVTVSLEAYSPFIPLNSDDSSIPAIIKTYTIKNTFEKTIEVDIAGWMENPVGLYSSMPSDLLRCNKIVNGSESQIAGLSFSLSGASCATDVFEEVSKYSDYGTMNLSMIVNDQVDVVLGVDIDSGNIFKSLIEDQQKQKVVTKALDQKMFGAVGAKFSLGPGQSHTVDFVVSWHFENLSLKFFDQPVGRYYGCRFKDANEVARYIGSHFGELQTNTKLWNETWYDSSLPYWFLNRTFANTSTLATSTAHRFSNGRFYGWEGVGCCQGTCTHVWHYAQAVARLFPDLERDLRTRVDFGIAFHPDTGLIDYRGDADKPIGAHDGQAGVILRAYREHQMSQDDTFLETHWPMIKRCTEYLIDQDENRDGIIEGAQPNTLDGSWYGKVSWLASLYLAALAASREMAIEVGDQEFVPGVTELIQRGKKNILELFNGEYFIQVPDPEHADSTGTYNGCYIDQVIGQSWAHQIGLGRLYERKYAVSALESLWKYNFTMDVGPFREAYKAGRSYAMAGEGGMIMCSWPKGDRRDEWDTQWQTAYFNECMSGFEWQVVSHLIWEGMIDKALVLARSIHERYNPEKRNPYNEIECGDHYARAMASYGAFIAACGFQYHGPKGFIAFAPKINSSDFKAPFTVAKGWGTFSQVIDDCRQRARLQLKYGHLKLRQIELEVPHDLCPVGLSVHLNDLEVAASFVLRDSRISVSMDDEIVINAGESLLLELDISH